MCYMSFMFYMDIKPPTIFHLEFLVKMGPITPPSPMFYMSFMFYMDIKPSPTCLTWIKTKDSHDSRRVEKGDS